MKNKTTIMSPLKILSAPHRTSASQGFQLAEPQPDLLYMKSVLVSTGQNKNDDVFLPEEMWQARSTPHLKPVNWEHNTGYEVVDSPEGNSRKIVADNQIIGVMYKAYPTHKDGTLIDDTLAQADNFEVPQEFDIVTEAAIYKYLFPKATSRIVNEAASDRLFVSMEAWFTSFDYRVGSKIVARNEDTAFLDRHLKSNGGDGVFEGQQVGRVLRNIVFGGVGMVANPANEDSVINSFTNAELMDAQIANSAVASNVIGQINSGLTDKESQEVHTKMADNNDHTSANQVNITHNDYKGVVERLVKAEHTIETKDSELAAAKAEVEALKAGADSIKSAFAKGAEALANVLGDSAAVKLSKADAGSFFDVVVEVVNDKLQKHDEVTAELSQAKTELSKLEEQSKLSARSEEIRDGLSLSVEDKERVEKLVASTEKLDDEAFASWLESTKELFSQAKEAVAKAPPFGKKEDEDEDKKKDKKDASVDGITDPSILDNAKATASVPAGVDDAVKPVSLPDRMQSLAGALWNLNKRSESN